MAQGDAPAVTPGNPSDRGTEILFLLLFHVIQEDLGFQVTRFLWIP